jgi:cytochrome c-type biogenesis protein CcmH
MNGRILIALALLVLAGALAFAARPHETTSDDRVDRITTELRCPVCQGLSVKDSTSETARQMRDLVAQRVREGRSDAAIEAEFRAAYGDWIFLSPPVAAWSGLVWLVPVAVIAAGLVLVSGRLRGTGPPQPTEATSMEVAALRERVAREEAAEG